LPSSPNHSTLGTIDEEGFLEQKSANGGKKDPTKLKEGVF